MLKFTAELSQEFRRASSFSSLKAYQISKSATKPVSWEAHFHPRFQTNYSNQQRAHDHLRLQHAHTYGNLDHCEMKRSRNHCHKPKRAYDYSNCFVFSCYPHQKNSQYSQNRQRNWSTPKRMEYPNTHQTFHKNLTSKSTTANKFYQSHNSQKRPQASKIETKFSLTELDPNKIAIKTEKDSKIRNAVNSIYPSGNENQNTTKKATNLNQRASHAAKMRISSINSLQNIQKRIQATLGQQAKLKI